jgi:hypothetical protein
MEKEIAEIELEKEQPLLRRLVEENRKVIAAADCGKLLHGNFPLWQRGFPQRSLAGRATFKLRAYMLRQASGNGDPSRRVIAGGVETDSGIFNHHVQAFIGHHFEDWVDLSLASIRICMPVRIGYQFEQDQPQRYGALQLIGRHGSTFVNDNTDLQCRSCRMRKFAVRFQLSLA